MPAHMTLTLETPDRAIASLRSDIDVTDKARSVRAIMTELNSVLSGTRRGMVRVSLASVAASQTVTMDQSAAVDATDTITIAGTALAVVAAPANQSEFLKGASNTAFADNLVACINAHSVLQKIVRAKRTAAAVVTIYCIFPGPIGNLVTLAEAGNGMTLGAAALASGASDETDSHQFGYVP